MTDRTLLITEVFPPQTGGSGRWFWEIYSRLPRENFVISAGDRGCNSAHCEYEQVNIERHPLSFPTWGCGSWSGIKHYFSMWKRIARIIGERQITAIHCGKILPEGWLAWLFSISKGLPYLCYVHGEELNIAMRSRELRFMAKRVLSNASLVVANSENSQSKLLNDWHVPPERLAVLYPGADINRFCPVSPDLRVMRELGWENRKVILTVGRLQKRKGHECLIRELPRIVERVPNVLYSIVGSGDQDPILRQLVDELKIHHLVQFLGELSDSMLIRCYQQCDLFVLPNREVEGDFEGFGMVLVEAQACGKPVIAGDTGGTAETMRVPDTGRIVSPEIPGNLSSVIVELLLNETLCHDMGRTARHWVAERFGWESLTKQASVLFGRLRPARPTMHC